MVKVMPVLQLVVGMWRITKMF